MKRMLLIPLASLALLVCLVLLLLSFSAGQSAQAAAAPRPWLGKPTRQPVPTAQPPNAIPPQPVPFIGEKFSHDKFPLTGAHGEPLCQNCHADGRYAGTNATCSACHQPPEPIAYAQSDAWMDVYALFHKLEPESAFYLYPDHFPGKCQDCHDVNSWKVADFNHQGVIECLSCHAEDMPRVRVLPDIAFISLLNQLPFVHIVVDEDHYPGVCTTCHVTAAWNEIVFDHLGQLNCVVCHADDTPENHYGVNCYTCHTVKDWRNAVLYHSSSADCTLCHAAPEDHYSGACSNCHNTVSWKTVTFDHTGYTNCGECHVAPANHWPGDCQDCHHTDSWTNVTFNHTGYVLRNACHERPDGHPRGQCSKCHTTDTWKIPTPPPGVIASPTPTRTVNPTNTPRVTRTPTPAGTATPAPSDTSEPKATEIPAPTQTEPAPGDTSTPTPIPTLIDPRETNQPPPLTPTPPLIGDGLPGTISPTAAPQPILTATPNPAGKQVVIALRLWREIILTWVLSLPATSGQQPSVRLPLPPTYR